MTTNEPRKGHRGTRVFAADCSNCGHKVVRPLPRNNHIIGQNSVMVRCIECEHILPCHTTEDDVSEYL